MKRKKTISNNREEERRILELIDQKKNETEALKKILNSMEKKRGPKGSLK